MELEKESPPRRRTGWRLLQLVMAMLIRRIRFCVAGSILLAFSVAVSAGHADPLPAQFGSTDFDASDPSAPEVTAANLLDSDRFWPYRARLAKPRPSPLTGKTITPGRPGILVRVEPPGAVRIDFASEGRLEVPIAETDVVEAANRVRLGKEAKLAPNLVLALGTRLADPESASGSYSLGPETPDRSYLLVFADPGAPSFDALAEALKPFQGRNDVLPILLPQGERQSREVRDTLLAKESPFVFVQSQYVAGYTRSLIDAGDKLPYLMLATPEGRVRYEGTATGGDFKALVAALEAALPR